VELHFHSLALSVSSFIGAGEKSHWEGCIKHFETLGQSSAIPCASCVEPKPCASCVEPKPCASQEGANLQASCDCRATRTSLC
jgi:hypothetical protein